MPYVKIPLHTLIKLSPAAYGCEDTLIEFDIPAVDTHRPRSAGSGSIGGDAIDGAAGMSSSSSSASSTPRSSSSNQLQAEASVSELQLRKELGSPRYTVQGSEKANGGGSSNTGSDKGSNHSSPDKEKKES